MDLLGLTHSGLQHGGSRLKGTRNIQGGTELSGIGGEMGGRFLPDRSAGKATILFLSPPPKEPQSQQVGIISESPSTWLTLFVSSW